MRLDVDLTQGRDVNIFFTSDFHLFHDNVLKFDNRPFGNVIDMHTEIENKWNEVVRPNDIVIYLGDLSFAKSADKPLVSSMIDRLNGEIHFVMGNHDRWEDIKKFTKFKTQQDYIELRIKEMKDGKKVETLFCCMHYPIFSHNKSHHGAYMVHGHTHGNLHHGEDASYYVNRRAIDVGCMLHDYYPISYLDVIEKLKDVKLPELPKRTE